MWSSNLLFCIQLSPRFFLSQVFQGPGPGSGSGSMFQKWMMQSNFIKITLLHGCSPVNLLRICRTASHKITSRVLLLSIIANKREKGDRKIQCDRDYVHSLFDIFISFLFRIVLIEKYKSIKAIENNFYHKVTEVKCSRNSN